jgi:hypothetical protein
MIKPSKRAKEPTDYKQLLHKISIAAEQMSARGLNVFCWNELEKMKR